MKILKMHIWLVMLWEFKQDIMDNLKYVVLIVKEL